MVMMAAVCGTGTAEAAEATGRAGCKVCGMYIDQYQHTAAELIDKDGQHLEACGMACLLRVVQDEGGPDSFTSIKVRDWESRELIAAADATYVIGSNITPDMMPSIIAFRSRDAAQKFIGEHGGEPLDFHQALSAVSPMGMTMPTRIKSAVLPSQGAFGVGLGYMYMKMDEIKEGSSSKDPDDFVRRPGQMMAPKEMTTEAEMLMLNYGLTDSLALGINISYLEKEMQMYRMGGNQVQTDKNSGLSDIDMSLRYNVWRDNYFSRFFSVLVGTTIPSGDFDTEWIDTPGLQLGTGDYTFTGGLLYSQRYNDFWFHALASYTYKMENDDDYKYGDDTRLGLAMHYTPNYDWLLGLELDTLFQGKNEKSGVDVGNTGGSRTNLAAVVDWKFLTALGGNFSLRVTAGLPIYEDLNHYTMGTIERVQLGGGYFTIVSINFKRRFQTE
jgi:nitrous oxide reductase accessory protein NosL